MILTAVLKLYNLVQHSLLIYVRKVFANLAKVRMIGLGQVVLNIQTITSFALSIAKIKKKKFKLVKILTGMKWTWSLPHYLAWVYTCLTDRYFQYFILNFIKFRTDKKITTHYHLSFIGIYGNHVTQKQTIFVNYCIRKKI